MSKRIIVIGVLIGVILVVAVIAGINFLGQTSNNAPANSPPTDKVPTNNTPPKAVLNVDGDVINGYWTRDVATDLPDYESTVSYSVSDVGNLDATNVSISISINGNSYSSSVVPSIRTSKGYSSSFSYSTPYDQTDTVLIGASCQNSSNSYTLSIGSTFPSSPYVNGFSSNIAELFVTPKEQNLVAMKNRILNDKFFLDFDWTALWEWVGNNVKYETEDSVTYHWQFPKDTLQSRYGMCADYSTLLVSMYRDGVFGPNDVYVVCGTNAQGEGHAWVIVRLPIVGWYVLDPQEKGFLLITLLENPFRVSGYTAQYKFNDQQFIAVSS